MVPTRALAVRLLACALALPLASNVHAFGDQPGPTPVAKPASTAGARFKVTIDPALGEHPVTGRLIVFTKSASAKVPERAEPLDGPFWSDPQPLFGIDVVKAQPGASIVLDDSAQGYPLLPGALPPGSYRAQARLDVRRESSQWRDQEGNLFGPAVSFVVPPSGEPVIVNLALNTRIEPKPPTLPDGVSIVEVKSDAIRQALLKETVLRASVLPPVNVQPGKKYPAIYEVPGFGGNHLDRLAEEAKRRAESDPNTPEGKLARSSYLIILDPESRNGHTLFADSFNNGDRGRALISELLPAIEAKHALIAEPSARLLRGHSSGGWSVLWLAINYSSTFGFAWSSSPDPVDFRSLQGVNIYDDANMYVDASGAERPSFVQNGKTIMTIRQECGGEDIIGPDNTSAQQWDSWFAAWGARNARGHPADLFDPRTGEMNRLTVGRYRFYDIDLKFRQDSRRFGPILRDCCQIVVGSADEFGLDKPVALLKKDLDEWVAKNPASAESKALGIAGITIVPGKTHGSIFGTPEIKAIPAQMLAYLKAHGHVQ